MSEIISLPKEAIQEKTATLQRPLMLEEIEQWCSENLHGGFMVSYQSMMSRANPSYPFEAFFCDDNDAIHFKLRWIG